MKPVYLAGWYLFRALFRIYCRWQVCNVERVPLTGPLILAANHASFLDPPLVGSSVPREIHYLARDTLMRFPPAGALLRHVNSIPVSRDTGNAAGLKSVLACLAAGNAIVLFPEGTRSPDGRLQRARSGIGLIVIKSGAPVVPVRIFGSHEALGRGRWFLRPAKIIVKYGRPIRFDALKAEAATASKARLRQIYQEVADQIMAAIAALEPYTDKETFP